MEQHAFSLKYKECNWSFYLTVPSGGRFYSRKYKRKKSPRERRSGSLINQCSSGRYFRYIPFSERHLLCTVEEDNHHLYLGGAISLNPVRHWHKSKMNFISQNFTTCVTLLTNSRQQKKQVISEVSKDKIDDRKRHQ